MKPISTLMLIIATALISSGEKEKVPESSKDLSGEWKWIYTWIVAPMSDSNPRTPQNTDFKKL
jgi:hypothetical protein